MRDSRDPVPLPEGVDAVTLWNLSSGVGAPRAAWKAVITTAVAAIAPNATIDRVALRWKVNQTKTAAPAAISAPMDPDTMSAAAIRSRRTYAATRSTAEIPWR